MQSLRIGTGAGLATLALLATLLTGCISIPNIGFSNDRGRVALETIEPAKGFFTEDQILMIPLDGTVGIGDQETGLSGDVGMLVSLKDRLDAARYNSRIKAVILRIDSPGGTVTAADLIMQEILRFKRETHIPVIALMEGTCASGGVYIAMAADQIYALPTTLTGSIGVIAMYPDVSGLMSKIGVQMNVIKAGKMKDEGSPFRQMTEEERELFQHIVDTYNERFRSVVLASREDKGMTREGLLKFADGRVLTPQQALDDKLIDGICYPERAIKYAMEAAKIDDAAVVSYEYPYHYRGHIYAQSDAPTPTASAAGTGGAAAGGTTNFNVFNIQGKQLIQELTGARFMYLWMP